jgi:acetyl-CoA C-acetyltransferase
LTERAKARIGITFNDAWLIAGVRTPFVDYNGALAHVSPIDLGIKVARDLLAQTATSPRDVETVIAGSMAQASFDAYMLPRHIGLYAGVPIEVPAYQVQRVCGTGIEVIMQAADTVSLGRSELALCVGTESMSRNPVVAYTHRGGFRMGQVEFKDFLWEALIDPAPAMSMGDTAEKLAKEYQITRAEVDAYASRSFERALAAQTSGFLAGEITPVKSESFTADGLNRRSIRLKDAELAADTHVRASSVEVLATLKPAFGGVHTGGNSSPSLMAPQPCWSAPRTTRGATKSPLWRASWPVPPLGFHPRSWASVRCRRSARRLTLLASSCPISTASRSTRPSARR